jgi:glycosyltransferase involved in cell wall biosynthesis
MLLSIVIPCLNEARTINRAIKQAHTAATKAKVGKFEIIVADSGSHDGSQLKIVHQKLARVIDVPIKGYGAALHWGILAAKGKYVMYADADLSYDFKELKKFLPLIKKGSVDVILGSRFKGLIKPGAMPFHHRYLGTPVLTWLIRTIYHLPTSDCNSGMRVLKRDFYRRLGMKNAGMEWASELLIRTALRHGKYAEVPITLHPDKRGRPPHLASWADGWRHLKAIVLLKPDLLFMVTATFFGLSFISFRTNLQASLIFILVGITSFFCTLSAVLIKHALDGEWGWLALFLMKLPVVQILGLLSIVAAGQFFIDPGEWLMLKMLILYVILMYCLWVFFIETIKTHLVHKLPTHLH